MREAALGLEGLGHAAQILARGRCAGIAPAAQRLDVADAREPLEDATVAAASRCLVGGRHARCSAAKRSAAEGSPAALRSMSVSSALMSASGRGGQPGEVDVDRDDLVDAVDDVVAVANGPPPTAHEPIAMTYLGGDICS